ncbi:neutral/alkaline non-lysosomal ceramidase N-terminal domain-containing protein [Nocardia jejuensis]|uniref:neutral/alkaline non-lysosomal ceramidase N-terminal domain-containing protein n=1 Tax=Nocardia jejuensis TaxID=328049 RepID=UPI0008309A86|nr:neutral/alkaline non-lysosomal ceramidase N-terminal domain-containing protein [Nocardia jejuensis]
MSESSERYLAGRGIADITGEAAGAGMLGYGMADQRTDGIHTRLRSRAFVFADGHTGRRVLLVVNDLPLIFSSLNQEVLRRLAARFGDAYTEHNVMLTATHTHCGPGGYAHHRLYNTTTGGFRPKTFGAIVDGIVEAVERAHADLAPASLRLAHGELHDASVNRSRSAFERNPRSDRDFFPDAVDPQTTLLRIDRAGVPVGAIDWFAAHNTSMTNRNTLISGDNKGYAAYHWERVVRGVDYLASPQPDFIAAFAQTNAGDMSPNLAGRPGHGPTDDEFENTRILGTRQFEAAAELATAAGQAICGDIDYRIVHVDLSAVTVSAEFTGDGREHRTGKPCAGASSLAGAGFDGPTFWKTFHEGRGSGWDRIANGLLYRLTPKLAAAQAPKAVVAPGGILNRLTPFVQEIAPVQLLRIGQLYLIGIPGEVTITAGLRLRRTVAGIVGADLADVLVAGYSNSYIHYVTTPEEYDEQRYEGGSTLFGRWELPALQQIAAALATAMRDGEQAASGPAAPDLAARQRSAKDRTRQDVPPSGHEFGDVLTAPAASYRTGSQVLIEFAGADPGNELRRGGTYLDVRRLDGEAWCTIADDNDWATKFRWRPDSGGVSRVTVTWDIPVGTPAGTYQIRYHGHAAREDRTLTEFTGVSGTFEVR